MSISQDDAIGGAKRVLVTGGAGFIGSHLCDTLIELGYRVTVVDDLRTGFASNISATSSRLTFNRLTLGDEAHRHAIETHFEQSDFVFHLASDIGVSFVHENPISTFESIVSSGSMVVNLCRKYQVPLLFTSSSEVYGANPIRPTDEDTPLVDSKARRFSYASAKIAVEKMVFDLYREGTTDSWVARFFNVAGPRQRPSAGVIASFAYALAIGNDPSIHGDGSQTRCFLHVTDAVNALLQIAGNAELAGRAVNIGNEETIRIRDLAFQMCHQAGKGIVEEVSYEAAFGRDFAPVHNRQPSTRLLRESTNWRPTRNLSEIIEDCTNYARESCLDQAGRERFA